MIEKKTIIRDDGSFYPERDTEIVTMPGWKIILVRSSRVYVQSLLGFLIAMGTGLDSAVGVDIPVTDFIDTFQTAMSLAVAPAVISLLQNIVEILSSLDVKHPGLRA